jgi:tRNA(Leu) C34 or U34 (ribose-2'-O)-methylase TrmL
VFGKESGLEQVLDLFAKENQLKIPCHRLEFNIANSVAFVIGEARGKLTAIVLVSIDILAR